MNGILDRLVDDEEIESRSPVFQIPDVELDTAFHLPELAGLATETVDLRPAGNTRLDKVANHVFVDDAGILFGVLQHVGTRTDDGHVAPENVDELGQLINTGLTDELAYPRLTGIVERSLQTVGIGVDTHGAELVTPEFTSVNSCAFLLEENGTGRGQLDGNAYDDIDNREERAKEKSGEQNVEGTFDQTVLDVGQRFATDGEYRSVADELHVHAALEVVADAGDAEKMDEMVLAIVDDGQNLLSVGGREAAEHHFDSVLTDPGNDVVDIAEVGNGIGVDQGGGRSKIALDAETIGRVDGDFTVEFVHVLIRTYQNDGAGVTSVAAVPLEHLAEREAIGCQTEEEGCIERNEIAEREGAEVGQVEKGAKNKGMQQYVAGRTTDNVVRTNDAAVEDDSTVVVAEKVDQIEQNKNLGERMDEYRPQRTFVEDPIEKHEKKIHDAEISQNDGALQQLIELQTLFHE